MKLFYASFFCLNIGFATNTLVAMENKTDLQIIQEIELKDRSAQIWAINKWISGILEKKSAESDNKLKEKISDMNYKVHMGLIGLCHNLDKLNKASTQEEKEQIKIDAQYVDGVMKQVNSELNNRGKIGLSPEALNNLSKWYQKLQLVTTQLKKELSQRQKT